MTILVGSYRDGMLGLIVSSIVKERSFLLSMTTDEIGVGVVLEIVSECPSFRSFRLLRLLTLLLSSFAAR